MKVLKKMLKYNYLERNEVVFDYYFVLLGLDLNGSLTF